MKSSILLLALSLFCICVFCAEDKVESLPGWPANLTSELYSGELHLSGTNKFLQYYFVTSQGAPTKDPIIFWLNGGPGCSSLVGLFSEIGPAVVEGNENEDLTINEWAWNKHANLLFIDSPFGVGFSYTPDIDSEEYNDENTIENLYNGLLAWYKKFPEYKGREFWIAGESYAGIYIPKLAAYIDSHKKDDTFLGENPFDLKGVLIGNGVTVSEALDADRISFAVNHKLVNESVYDDYRRYCHEDEFNDRCGALKTLVQDFMDSKKNVNPYDIYRKCIPDPDLPGDSSLKNEMPCVTAQAIIDYLNNDSVKKSLHVSESMDWLNCNTKIHDSYKKEKASSVEDFKKLKNKYKIFLWSGETDFAVPYVHTLEWMLEIDPDVTEDWRTWSLNEEIAGNTFKTSSMTLATLKNIGHMVPVWNREGSYTLVSKFMNNEVL